MELKLGDHVKARWMHDGVEHVVGGTIVSIRQPGHIYWVMWFDNEITTQEHISDLELQKH